MVSPEQMALGVAVAVAVGGGATVTVTVIGNPTQVLPVGVMV